MVSETTSPPSGRVSLFGRVWAFLMGIWTTASDRNIGLIAAGVAFFGMFAIFPALAALIAVFGMLADPTAVMSQIDLMREIIPEQAYYLLIGQVGRLLAARSETLGLASLFSIGLALWAARAGVAALMGGLNAIAGRPPRNGFKQVIVALTLTVSLVLLAVVAMLAVIVAPIILAYAPLRGGGALLLEGLRWLVAFAAAYAALALLYRFGPNQRGARLRWFSVGAISVIVVWIVASVALSYYLTNFASYNEVYGSIGAVIGMMLWLYVTAYLVLLGAALNLRVHGHVDGSA